MSAGFSKALQEENSQEQANFDPLVTGNNVVAMNRGGESPTRPAQITNYLADSGKRPGLSCGKEGSTHLLLLLRTTPKEKLEQIGIKTGGHRGFRAKWADQRVSSRRRPNP